MDSTAFVPHVERRCDLTGKNVVWQSGPSGEAACVVPHDMAPHRAMEAAFPLRDPEAPFTRVHPRYARPDGQLSDKVEVKKVQLEAGLAYFLMDTVEEDLDNGRAARLPELELKEWRAKLKGLRGDVKAEMERLIKGEMPTPPRYEVRRLEAAELPPHEQMLAGQHGLFAPDLSTERPLLSNGKVLGLYLGALVETDDELVAYRAQHAHSEAYEMAVDCDATLSGQGAANGTAFANTALLPDTDKPQYDHERLNATFLRFKLKLTDKDGGDHWQHVIALAALDNLYAPTNPSREVRTNYGNGYLQQFEKAWAEARMQGGKTLSPVIKQEPASPPALRFPDQAADPSDRLVGTQSGPLRSASRRSARTRDPLSQTARARRKTLPSAEVEPTVGVAAHEAAFQLNHEAMMRVLEQNGLEVVRNDGRSRGGSVNNCLIISLLQHATGRYDSSHAEAAADVREALMAVHPDIQMNRPLHSDDPAAQTLIRLISERYHHEREMIVAILEPLADGTPLPWYSSAPEVDPDAVMLVANWGHHFEAVRNDTGRDGLTVCQILARSGSAAADPRVRAPEGSARDRQPSEDMGDVIHVRPPHGPTVAASRASPWTEPDASPMHVEDADVPELDLGPPSIHRDTAGSVRAGTASVPRGSMSVAPEALPDSAPEERAQDYVSRAVPQGASKTAKYRALLAANENRPHPQRWTVASMCAAADGIDRWHAWKLRHSMELLRNGGAESGIRGGGPDPELGTNNLNKAAMAEARDFLSRLPGSSTWRHKEKFRVLLRESARREKTAGSWSTDVMQCLSGVSWNEAFEVRNEPEFRAPDTPRTKAARDVVRHLEGAAEKYRVLLAHPQKGWPKSSMRRAAGILVTDAKRLEIAMNPRPDTPRTAAARAFIDDPSNRVGTSLAKKYVALKERNAAVAPEDRWPEPSVIKASGIRDTQAAIQRRKRAFDRD